MGDGQAGFSFDDRPGESWPRWPRPRNPTTLVVIGSLLFGTVGTAQALGPASASPGTVGAARIVIGGLVLGALAAAASRGVGRGGRLNGSVVAAGVGIGLYQLAFFTALSKTGVAVGTAIAMGMVPAFVGVIALTVRGERPGRRWAVATAVTVVGATVLVLPSGEVGVDLLGLLLALAAAGSYAIYTVALKGLLESGRRPVEAVAVAYAFGAVVLSPFLLLGDVGWLGEPSGVLMVLYLGAGPTALAYILVARGLARLRPATVATLTLVDPLSAAFLGIAVLGERPSGSTVVGAGLVLFGLVLLGGARDSAASNG